MRAIKTNQCGHLDRKHYCKNKCRECYTKFRKESGERRSAWEKWYKGDKGQLYQHLNKLKRFSGMTPERYDNLLESQQSLCAICGNSEEMVINGQLRKLCIDHNHSTETIRGLLCAKCNSLLGNCKENIEVLKSAINYLEGSCIYEAF